MYRRWSLLTLHNTIVCAKSILDSGFKLMTHSPYSPDLAPGDFYLFSKAKENIGGSIYYYILYVCRYKHIQYTYIVHHCRSSLEIPLRLPKRFFLSLEHSASGCWLVKKLFCSVCYAQKTLLNAGAGNILPPFLFSLCRGILVVT